MSKAIQCVQRTLNGLRAKHNQIKNEMHAAITASSEAYKSVDLKTAVIIDDAHFAPQKAIKHVEGFNIAHLVQPLAVQTGECDDLDCERQSFPLDFPFN